MSDIVSIICGNINFFMYLISSHSFVASEVFCSVRISLILLPVAMKKYITRVSVSTKTKMVKRENCA